jgi:hypothetical protein
MRRSEARERIEYEDAITRADRIAGLEWLASNDPSSELGFMLLDGWAMRRPWWTRA